MLAVQAYSTEDPKYEVFVVKQRLETSEKVGGGTGLAGPVAAAYLPFVIGISTAKWSKRQARSQPARVKTHQRKLEYRK